MADRSQKLLWAACLTIGLYPWFALLRLPGRYVALTTEGGVGELTQAVMFGGAALLTWREVRACKRAGSPWLPLSVLAAGLSFVALEEVSWGQSFLGLSVPALQSVNVQSEVNLHNLTSWVHAFQQSIVPIITFVYGISVPLELPGARWITDLFRRFNLPLAPPCAMPLFLLATISFAPIPVFTHVEVAELLLAAAMLVTAGVSTNTGSPRRALLAIGYCLGLAMLVANFGPRIGFERGDAQRRMLIAEHFYLPSGMMRNAERLIEEEIGRYNGSLTTASQVEALSYLAEWQRASPAAMGPTQEFLERSAQRGQYDLARTHLSLAVLMRMAGREEEAAELLRQADRAFSPLIGGSGEPVPFSERQALVRLRACQGRKAEAIQLLENSGAAVGRRSAVVLRDRIERLSALFDSVDVAE